MSRRVAWKCPDCGCSYRVPAEQRATASCPKCAGKRRGDDDNIEFAEAPEPTKKTFSISVTRSAAASSVSDPFLEAASREQARSEPARSESDRSEPSRNRQTHREESATAKRLNKPTGDDSQRDDVILDRLDELTKSMRFFKRLVWCMIIATALNALIMGIGLFYSMSMLGSIGSVFSSAGEIDPEKLQNGEGLEELPPGMRQNLQAIQAYSDMLNELSEEPN